MIKGNDQPEGELTAFKLESAELGLDEDGDPVTTAILSNQLFDGGAQKPGAKLSDRQKLALEALTEATLSHGRNPPGEFQLPASIQVVTADEWKAELFRRNVLDQEGSNPRARFADLRNALAARKKIGTRDGLVWSVY